MTVLYRSPGMGCGQSKKKPKKRSEDRSKDQGIANEGADTNSKDSRSDKKTTSGKTASRDGLTSESIEEVVSSSKSQQAKADSTVKSDANPRNKSAQSNGNVKTGAEGEKTRELNLEIPSSRQQTKDSKLTPLNSAPPQVSGSQLEFFKMLDDKIAQGQDYLTEERPQKS